MRGFYLVWSPTGAYPPRVRLATEAEALRAADTMAEKHPGHRFFVMLATHYSEKPIVGIIQEKLDDPLEEDLAF